MVRSLLSMALSLPRSSVWLLAFPRKLQSGHCREVTLTLMEPLRLSYPNLRSAIQFRGPCSELLTEGRSPVIRQTPKIWSAQLFWWITRSSKDNGTTVIRLPRTSLGAAEVVTTLENLTAGQQTNV